MTNNPAVHCCFQQGSLERAAPISSTWFKTWPEINKGRQWAILVSEYFEFASLVEIYIKVQPATKMCRLALWTDCGNVYLAMLNRRYHLAFCYSRNMRVDLTQAGKKIPDWIPVSMSSYVFRPRTIKYCLEM